MKAKTCALAGLVLLSALGLRASGATDPTILTEPTASDIVNGQTLAACTEQP
jgi:hypothetical protein